MRRFRGHFEDLRRARQDLAQRLVVVIFHTVDRPKRSRRERQRPTRVVAPTTVNGAARDAGTRARSLPIITSRRQKFLHRRIKPLLDRALAKRWISSIKALRRLERGQDRGQVARVLDAGPRLCANLRHSAAIILHSVVLPRPGRPVEQDVIDGLFAPACSLQQDIQILFDPSPANIFSQPRGRSYLNYLFFFAHLWRDEASTCSAPGIILVKRAFYGRLVFHYSKVQRRGRVPRSPSFFLLRSQSRKADPIGNSSVTSHSAAVRSHKKSFQ